MECHFWVSRISQYLVFSNFTNKHLLGFSDFVIFWFLKSRKSTFWCLGISAAIIEFLGFRETNFGFRETIFRSLKFHDKIFMFLKLREVSFWFPGICDWNFWMCRVSRCNFWVSHNSQFVVFHVCRRNFWISRVLQTLSCAIDKDFSIWIAPHDFRSFRFWANGCLTQRTLAFNISTGTINT